jgi:hypothetical protein
VDCWHRCGKWIFLYIARFPVSTLGLVCLGRSDIEVMGYCVVANSKRRCSLKSCDDPYFRPEDGIIACGGKLAFCTFDHQVAYGVEQGKKFRAQQSRIEKRTAKEDRQKHTRQKKRFYENDTKTRKAAAVREFNSYIRERDKGLPCISCGKPIRLADYDAGHYIPAGSNSLLKFDEVNTNGQCAFYCNHSRSGNQVEYRKGLLERYGEAEVIRLESTNGTIKRTAEDYKKIEVEYKNKRLGLTQQTQGQAA